MHLFIKPYSTLSGSHIVSRSITTFNPRPSRMSIHNSSNFTIQGGSTLNSVGRDQFNITHNQTIFAEVANFATAPRTEYDEFEYVKRGHVIVLKELQDWEWRWKNGQSVVGQHKNRSTTFCTVRVYPDQQSKFTAVFYEGDDANRLWEQDFRQFSRTRNTSTAQLFGVNRSEVPMLIFHDELIPLGHFYTNSFWSDIYVNHLALNNLKCSRRSLWMDSKGTICAGPKGPQFNPTSSRTDNSIIVPPTRDMLVGETAFRFFADYKSQLLDRCVLEYASRRWKHIFLDDLDPNLRISRIANSIR